VIQINTPVNYYLMAGFVIFAGFKLAACVYFNVEGVPVFGGGSDANFYHAYAISGEIRPVPNIWPSILRFLNQLGLYSRDYISYILQILSVIVLPLCIAKAGLVNSKGKSKVASLTLVIIISLSPTIFFYGLDVYRDVFMLFCFTISVALVKKFIGAEKHLTKLFLFAAISFMIFVLFGLRPYLGVAFAVSFVAYKFIKIGSRKIYLLFTVYIFFLLLLYDFGFLGELMKYRDGFEEMGGGTNLVNGFEYGFFVGISYSVLQQLFGLYIGDIKSSVFFILETVPFVGAFIFILVNRRFSTDLVGFLLVFFMIYSSVWLIGNANFGTGVRLRMFSYLSVYLSAFIIYQYKHDSCSVLKNKTTKRLTPLSKRA